MESVAEEAEEEVKEATEETEEKETIEENTMMTSTFSQANDPRII